MGPGIATPLTTRRRVIALKSSGYSVAEIRKSLSEENVLVSLQVLFNLRRKHRQTGKLLDLTRKPRPRKLTQVMVNKLNEALSDNARVRTVKNPVSELNTFITLACYLC